ncbi:MAG: hypothetical protein U0414_36085 [Polyangiaceae bacterium]
MMKLVVPLFAVVFLSQIGCSEPPARAPVEAKPVEIGRDAAVYAAAMDAETRFGIRGLRPLTANRTGEVWIIEMSGEDGSSVHYAVGAADGTIRERRVRR